MSYNLNLLLRTTLEQNQTDVKVVWFDTSRNGVITYIDLNQLNQATRRQKLEALAQSGALGAFIHKSDGIFAALHQQHAENFRRVNSGLKIEGKKVEVVELSDTDYLQFMSAAISHEVMLNDEDKQEEQVLLNIAKKPNDNTGNFLVRCIRVHAQNSQVMRILDDVREGLKETKKMLDAKEKEAEMRRQFDTDTNKIVQKRKDHLKQDALREMVMVI